MVMVKGVQSPPTSQWDQLRTKCWAEAKMPSQSLGYRGTWQRDPQLRAAGLSSQAAQKGIEIINPRLYYQDFSSG